MAETRLCTMCMHGINETKLWICRTCGSKACSHVRDCACGGRFRPPQYKAEEQAKNKR